MHIAGIVGGLLMIAATAYGGILLIVRFCPCKNCRESRRVSQ